VSGRDAVWSHPDLLPTADDFDDPDGFVRGRPELDISGLEDLANGETSSEDDGDQGGDTDQGGDGQPDQPPSA
jgi:Zincin-like metallopeptidase